MENEIIGYSLLAVNTGIVGGLYFYLKNKFEKLKPTKYHNFVGIKYEENLTPFLNLEKGVDVVIRCLIDNYGPTLTAKIMENLWIDVVSLETKLTMPECIFDGNKVVGGVTTIKQFPWSSVIYQVTISKDKEYSDIGNSVLFKLLTQFVIPQKIFKLTNYIPPLADMNNLYKHMNSELRMK